MSSCCEEGTTVVPNPMIEHRGGRKSKRVNLFDAENPIPNEIKDTDELQKVIAEYRLVPYAGSSQHSGDTLLDWYLMLVKLSPTQSAAIQKITKYVVGSRVKIVAAEDPEFDSGAPLADLSVAEKEAYAQAIKETIEYKDGIRSFHKKLQSAMSGTGNAWAELSISTVNGQTRAAIKYVKVTDVRYIATKPGELRAVAVSPKWDSEYLRKNPPTKLPIAPTFLKGKDGVLRTMFHLKSGDGNWYGRPDSEGAAMYAYREVQDAIYLIKQAAGNFVGQLIIEVEDDDAGTPAIDNAAAQQSGFDSFATRMEENYTNKGSEPQAVLVTARPIGSRPMFVHQVKPNTNEAWYKVTGEISEQKIVREHCLTLRFMGFDVAGGFGANSFVEDYVMNVEPIISEHRATLMAFSNSILSLVWEVAGKPELNKYSITFESPIQTQVNQYKQNGNQGTNNAL